MDQIDISNFITAVGAMCEVAALLRDGLIKNGFTRDEAVLIVQNYIIEQMLRNDGD